MLVPEYLSVGTAALLWAALSVAAIGIATRGRPGRLASDRGLLLRTATRVLLLGLIVLVLSGARWERENDVVEVLVVRDESQSTTLASDLPAPTLRESVDRFLLDAMRSESKRPDDRIGVVSFDVTPRVDVVPNTQYVAGGRAIRAPAAGTNVADAIHLGLASLNPDARHRLLLIWDGTQTEGDLDSAVRAARAQGVPIDVMPLEFAVTNEVIVERLVVPPRRRRDEPLAAEVVLRSTNAGPVTGTLRLTHQGRPVVLEEPGVSDEPTARTVTLRPGRNVETIRLPGLPDAGVHRYRAIFTPQTRAGLDGEPAAIGDTLVENNVAEGFTFVDGAGRVLLVENVTPAEARPLREALGREGIDFDADRSTVDAFPEDLLGLADYDAVVLVDVPRGPGGLSDTQQEALASYVHDLGGGLVMVGGPNAYGAGGWQGTTLESVLPVDMDVPSRRQLPKGALVVILHSCEMPDGNFWGVQCGLEAAKVLHARDEIGVLSYDWKNGGSNWDYPLSPKGDGSAVAGAIQSAQLGDMPSFDDALTLALNGGLGSPGLKDSDARQKHVIIVSDGDPSLPNPGILAQFRAAGVSVSTVQVYGHTPGVIEPVMQLIPRSTAPGGRFYGPIENNPDQLPQIFVKEATLVRRSLIVEDRQGLAVRRTGGSDELLGGVTAVPPVYGMVLSTPKNDARVELPLIAGQERDPVLAYWQTGLGRVATFMSDAHDRWSAAWVRSDWYDAFWARLVRQVSRPAEAQGYEVRVEFAGERGRVSVEATHGADAFAGTLTIRGAVVGPDGRARDVRLTQTRPGWYEGTFPARQPGGYVVGLSYVASDGTAGVMRGGGVLNGSLELRELRSNPAAIRAVAEATGGRVLAPFDVESAGALFDRLELPPNRSYLPIWDVLLPIVIGWFVLDVAARRLVVDRGLFEKWRAKVQERVIDLTGGFRPGSTPTPTTAASVPSPTPAAARVGEERGVGQTGERRPAPPWWSPGDAADSKADDVPSPGASNDAPSADRLPAGGTVNTDDLLAAKRRARERIQRRSD